MATGHIERLARKKTVDNAIFRGLTVAGRNSLAIYLLHQPVLIALVWLATQIHPPAGQDPVANMVEACVIECSQTRDEAFCTAYCVCVMDEVLSSGLFNELRAGTLDPAGQPLAGFVAGCTARAER